MIKKLIIRCLFLFICFMSFMNLTQAAVTDEEKMKWTKMEEIEAYIQDEYGVKETKDQFSKQTKYYVEQISESEDVLAAWKKTYRKYGIDITQAISPSIQKTEAIRYAIAHAKVNNNKEEDKKKEEEEEKEFNKKDKKTQNKEKKAWDEDKIIKYVEKTYGIEQVYDEQTKTTIPTVVSDINEDESVKEAWTKTLRNNGHHDSESPATTLHGIDKGCAILLNMTDGVNKESRENYYSKSAIHQYISYQTKKQPKIKEKQDWMTL